MDDIEASLARLRDSLKAKADQEHGPGAFDQMVRKGRILMTTNADDLTEEQRAVLDAPPPAQCN